MGTAAMSETYEGLDDNEVIAMARDIYRQFQVTPRWSAANDVLLRQWGSICGEMSRRGISEVVTEGGRQDVIDLFKGE